MSISCPSCGANVEPNDAQIARELARCDACATRFPIVIRGGSTDLTIRFDDLPRSRHRATLLLLGVFFGLIPVLLAGMLIQVIVTSPSAKDIAIFVAAMVVTTLPPVGLILAALQTHRIEATPKRLRVVGWPIERFGRVDLSRSDLGRFYVEQADEPDRRERQEDRAHYQVFVTTRDGETIALTGLSPDLEFATDVAIQLARVYS